MRHIIGLFFFLLLLLFAPKIYPQSPKKNQTIENKGKGLWKNSKHLVFEYKGKLEIDEENGIFLADVSDITTDSLGNIYVCDGKDHCIKIFDDKGIFKFSIGKQGQGPGEFLNPKNIFITHNKIYVSDSNRRISIFELNGTFVNNLTTYDFMINDMCISQSKKFLYCTPVSPMHHFKEKMSLPGIYIQDLTEKQWREIGEIPYIGKTDNGYQTVGNTMISSLSSGDILYAIGYPYELKLYTDEGELKTIITRVAKEIAEPKFFEIAPGIDILIARTEIRKIYDLSKNNFMIGLMDLGKNFLKLYEKSPEYSHSDISLYYDLYNAQGEFLQSFPVDNPFEIGFIMHCDKNNFVYTYNPDWESQTVKKYFISFVDSKK